MSNNRAVGYINGATLTRGAVVQFASLSSGKTVTWVKCRTKYVFATDLNIASYSAAGVWGNAIQYSTTGSAPTAWTSAATDPSILAFDNAEPLGLERIVWAPGNASLNIAVSFTSELQWKGQLHLPAAAKFYLVPEDVSGAAQQFTYHIAWQIWYTD